MDWQTSLIAVREEQHRDKEGWNGTQNIFRKKQSACAAHGRGRDGLGRPERTGAFTPRPDGVWRSAWDWRRETRRRCEHRGRREFIRHCRDVQRRRSRTAIRRVDARQGCDHRNKISIRIFVQGRGVSKGTGNESGAVRAKFDWPVSTPLSQC